MVRYSILSLVLAAVVAHACSCSDESGGGNVRDSPFRENLLTNTGLLENLGAWGSGASSGTGTATRTAQGSS